MSGVAPLLWTLPWIVPPLVALVRASRSRSLDDESDVVPKDAPLVSVIIPARNERRNIVRCVRSVLDSAYPRLAVIVVDDYSTDGTGKIAHDMARVDNRLRVVENTALPHGWFGKQWACATGASEAEGELLLFTDADTKHAPDLIPRAVNALRATEADLLSIAGDQEMHSFWERVIQPQMFGFLAIRYGGTESVSHARNPVHVIANGQFILTTRTAYDAVGGHASVRDQVAEDLALAQAYVRAGRRLVLRLAAARFSTHMYASLAEVISGWRKNIYTGGRLAGFDSPIGRVVFPLFLLGTLALGLVPVVVFPFAVAGVLSTSWLVWSGSIVATALVFWALVYRFMKQPVYYALLFPLGHAAVLYIAAASILRGNRVAWKEREYVVR